MVLGTVGRGYCKRNRVLIFGQNYLLGCVSVFKAENYESQIIGYRDNHVVQESSISGDTLVFSKTLLKFDKRDIGL